MTTTPIVKSMHTAGLALDVGERRIGVAVANLEVRFASPLTTLQNPVSFIEDVIMLCAEHDAAWLVLGLPRGLSGQETDQTRWVRQFAAELQPRLQIPLYWIDEALTSVKAETELRNRKRPYAKHEVDALAATYILEDFLQQHMEVTQ